MNAPLPRSLQPLPDESLTGFVLRLSHRLDLSPTRLAARTGLGPALLALHNLRMPDTTAAAFAHATRLSIDEVRQLSLDSLRERYPPLNLHYRNDARVVRRDKDLPHVRGWLLTGFSRYCPDCLAGDGSGIQSTHGGPWRKQWRLAVVFACPLHRRLLHHRCPGCGSAALQRSITGAGQLIPAPLLIQHPAQCRALPPRRPDRTASVCGYRLDHARPPANTQHIDELLAALDRCLAHLQFGDERASSRATSGSEYFYDILLIMRLIRASWPFAAQFAPSHVALDPIETHIEHLEHEMDALRAAGAVVHDLRLHAGPPEDSLECGHLLALTDHARTHSVDVLPDLLMSFRNDAPWIEHLEQLLRHCSPSLRAIAQSHIDRTRPRRRVARRSGRIGTSRPGQQRLPKVQLRHTVTFDPGRIPHLLPDDQMQPLLDLVPESAIPRRMLDRFVAVVLTRSAVRVSLRQAEELLHLPVGWGQSANTTVYGWAYKNGGMPALETAVNRVVEHVIEDHPTTDYRRRREALKNWAIPEDRWVTAVDSINPVSKARGSWGSAKRRRVSLLLWVLITSGDYQAAPLYRSHTGRIRDDRTSSNAVHRMMFDYRGGRRLPGRGAYIFDLLDALDPYRAHLEAAIDNAASVTDIDPASRWALLAR